MEFEADLDKHFPKDADLKPAEMHNYFSSLNAGAKDKVEATLFDELASGNYLISDIKPRIVSTLGGIKAYYPEGLIQKGYYVSHKL